MNYLRLYHSYVINCVDRCYDAYGYDAWCRLGMPAGIASAID